MAARKRWIVIEVERYIRAPPLHFTQLTEELALQRTVSTPPALKGSFDPFDSVSQLQHRRCALSLKIDVGTLVGIVTLLTKHHFV
jgi:hypothetical protein